VADGRVTRITTTIKGDTMLNEGDKAIVTDIAYLAAKAIAAGLANITNTLGTDTNVWDTDVI